MNTPCVPYREGCLGTLAHPVNTGCLPLKTSSNPGVTVSYREGCPYLTQERKVVMAARAKYGENASHVVWPVSQRLPEEGVDVEAPPCKIAQWHIRRSSQGVQWYTSMHGSPPVRSVR